MEKGACYNCSASGVHVDTTIPLTTGGNTGWFATKQQGARRRCCFAVWTADNITLCSGKFTIAETSHNNAIIIEA